MIEDIELLRRYVETSSETAFAELVQRRIGLVYSVALRQVGGDAHLAQDVTQRVFADLARKAKTLVSRPALSGWLYRSTHFCASDLVRAERRRRAREQASELMHPIQATNGVAQWDRLRPLLDDAMNDLNNTDRDAVALRFFEGRAFAEIGRALRLTEDLARKRVERALDKMAAALARRGVKSTSAALAIALAEQAAFAAPVGLATAVTSTALAGAHAATGWSLSAFLASHKLTATIATIALIASGTALYQSRKLQQTDAALAAEQRQQQTLLTQAEAAQTRLQMTEQRARAADDDNTKLLTAIESARVSRTSAQALASSSSSRLAVAAKPREEADSTAPVEPRVRLRLIQLKREEGMTDATLINQANLIFAHFRNGESFASLAEKYSTDARRARGGDWGWIKRADLKPAFVDAVFNLQKGQISAPLVLREGCFIMYAEDRE